MGEQGVFAAGRAVRWYLPDLVGPAAKQVDDELVELLAHESEAGSAARLRRLLEGREGTSAFLEAVLDDAPVFRPPQVQPSDLKSSDHGGLPGAPGVEDVPFFRCPAGDDFDWWQVAVGMPVPSCPTHGAVLVRG